MARSYANIATRVWRDDEDFRVLSAGAQRMYMLLLTQADISAAGVLAMKLRWWVSRAADTTMEGVREALAELADARFVVIDEDTEELLVRSFVRWDGGTTNEKRRVAIEKAAKSVNSVAIRCALRTEFERIGLPIDGLPDALSMPYRRPFDSRGVVVTVVATDPQPTTRNQQPATTSEGNAPSDAIESVRQDVERVCAHLADRVAANGSKRPTVTAKWRDAARLLIDKDGHTEQQVINAIDWCQNHEFWRTVVMSMPKLREKYDQMRLQAQGKNGAAKPSTTDQRVAAGLALAEQYRQRGE